VHMDINGKIMLIETVPGIAGGNKGEWWTV
jgi:hypothetical protein